MREKLSLYQPEDTKFKERTTQHLKRPALVTIKKPLLQPSEMEDVLTRLLRATVPPEVPIDNRAFYDSGKGKVRAIVIGRGKKGCTYPIETFLQENVNVIRTAFNNSFGIVHSTQNILIHEDKVYEDVINRLVKQNNELQKAMNSKDAVRDPNIKETYHNITNLDNPNTKRIHDGVEKKSKKRGLVSRIWSGVTDALLQAVDIEGGNAARAGEAIFAENFTLQASADERNREKAYGIQGKTSEEREMLTYNRVDLYLFYKSDHDALRDFNIPIPTDKHSKDIYYDDADLIANNEGWTPKVEKGQAKSKRTGDTVEVLRPKYVDTIIIRSDTNELKYEINNKNKRQQVKANMAVIGETPTNYELQRILINNIWGAEAVKKRKYTATLYHFVCLIKPQNSWEITQAGTKTTDIFKTQANVMSDYMQTLENICTRLDKNINSFNEKHDPDIVPPIGAHPTKNILTIGRFIQQAALINNGAALTEDQIKKGVKGHVANFEDLRTAISSLDAYVTGYEKRNNPENRYKNVKGSFAIQYDTYYAQLNDIVSDVHKLMELMERMDTVFDAGYGLQDNINKLPILPTDLNTKTLLDYDNYLRLQESFTIANLTTRAAIDDSFGSFTVRYYSILLEKIKSKYKQYSEFFPDGKDLFRFPYYREYKEACDLLAKSTDTKTGRASAKGPLKSKQLNPSNYAFIRAMEVLLFGPYSGFYITSKSTEEKQPTAPMVNATPTEIQDFAAESNSADVIDAGLRRLLQTKNDDVSNISISRSTASSTESTCTLLLKNYDHKYNFTQSQLHSTLSEFSNKGIKSGIELIDKSENIFSPLDEVTVYLPDQEGRLRAVYKGLITKIQAQNMGGYNQITLNCTCQKRLLDLSRTNNKPSFSRDEADNNQVIPFTVHPMFLHSMQLWMPAISVPALTYLGCQPMHATEELFNKQLFTLTTQKIQRAASRKKSARTGQEVVTTTDNPLTKKDIVAIKQKDISKKDAYVSQVLSSSNITGVLENKNINLESGTALINTETKVPNVLTYNDIVEFSATAGDLYDFTTEDVPDPEYATYKNYSTYQQVKFSDQLYNFIWYKTNTHGSITDTNIINTAFMDLLNEYVDTTVVGTSDSPGVQTRAHGICNLQTLIDAGERVAYLVFKQRYDIETADSYLGSLLKNTVVFPRETVLKFLGTTQPAFLLQPGAPEIQFSNWKTNAEIFKEVANKYDFVFYADRYGTLIFAPINLDLSSLGSTHYTDVSFSTKVIGETLPSHYLESLDKNYQILKQKNVIDYKRVCDERRLLNWIPLTGQMQIAGDLGMIKAQVQDPTLIAKLGIRASKNVTVIGCPNQETLQYYGMCWMDRNNKRYLASDISGIFDSSMDINMPYYVHFDNTIYYCESLQIQYTPGGTCKYTMGGTFGRKPLLLINPEDPKSAKENLTKLYTSNVVKPSIYSQYCLILDRAQSCNEIIAGINAAEPIKQRLIDLDNHMTICKDTKQWRIEDKEAALSSLDELHEDQNYLISIRDDWSTQLSNLQARGEELQRERDAAIEAGDEEAAARLDREIFINVADQRHAEEIITSLGPYIDGYAVRIKDTEDTVKNLTSSIDKLTDDIQLTQQEITNVDNQLTQHYAAMAPVVQQSGISAITRDTTADEVTTMRNSLLAVVCYNGYIWDNISGITFEELPYYATYLVGFDKSRVWESAILGNSKSNSTRLLDEVANIMKKNSTQEELAQRNTAYAYVTNLIAMGKSLQQTQKNNIIKSKYFKTDDLYLSPLMEVPKAKPVNQ